MQISSNKEVGNFALVSQGNHFLPVIPATTCNDARHQYQETINKGLASASDNTLQNKHSNYWWFAKIYQESLKTGLRFVSSVLVDEWGMVLKIQLHTLRF